MHLYIYILYYTYDIYTLAKLHRVSLSFYDQFRDVGSQFNLTQFCNFLNAMFVVCVCTLRGKLIRHVYEKYCFSIHN